MATTMKIVRVPEQAAKKRAGDIQLPVELPPIEAMAAVTPEELFAALTDQVGRGSILASEASQVYARAHVRRMEIRDAADAVNVARSVVLEAANELVVYYINGVGRSRTKASDAEGIRAHRRLTDAVDALIAASQKQGLPAARPVWQWSPEAVARMVSDLER